MLRIGIDGGNSTTITAIDDREPIIIPTIIASYKDYSKGFDFKKKRLKDMLDVEIELNFNNKQLKKNLGRYYVGNLAKSEGQNVKIRNIGQIKKGDDWLFITMLTSMAVAVIEEQQKFEGTLTQEVKFVTGLPFIQYQDKEEFMKQFIGSHKVKFRGPYEIDVELYVNEGFVEVEGAGALNTLIFSDNGYILPAEELIGRNIVGIEIGEFTSEIITLTFVDEEDEGIVPEYKHKLCTGFDLGIATAKQFVIDFLREEKKTLIDRYDIDAALKLPGARKGLIDCDNGERLNILEIYEMQLNELAQKLAARISDKVNNSGEKGKIIHTLIYGGGACALDFKFGNALRDAVKKTIGGESEIAKDPHLVNAIGYLEKANALFDIEG
ncbi:MAG: hypothetical protein BWY74_00047 [Firmicutes bacterium ADurb.Bin419]|nr:MAG: hypothetical protein BWY74_00047 [Firmicutes bacterium ADurb.Bin419]